MTNLDTVQSFISTADADTLTALEVSINQTRAARIEARNAALPDFPWVISLSVPAQGHRAGQVVQVSKASALELIAAGTHQLASAEELSAYNSRTA